MKIVVVGVGALGSHFVQFIRNTPADIRVIDFDRVEQKNVGAQFHGKPGVGKSKVEALRQVMDFLFKRTISVNNNKVVDNNVDVLLPKEDCLLVDCLDNGASRRLLQAYARQHNTPLLHGALSASGDFGRCIWDEGFVVDDEGIPGTPTCENGEALPFIVVVAAYLAMCAQEFVRTGKKTGFSISPAGSFLV